MAKASPGRNSFNAGIFSKLLEGRVDIDRYPASMREMRNFVAAPQGPAIRRSGTKFILPNADETKVSGFVNFEFNEDQLSLVELCGGRARFLTEDGVVTYPPVNVTAVIAGMNVQITATLLGANVGEEVALSGFPVAANVNGQVAKVLAKSGDVYTLGATYPAGITFTGGQASRVYSLAVPYTSDANIRDVYGLQDDDAIYLFLDGKQPQRLARLGNTDWSINPTTFKKGPFMDAFRDGSSLSFSGTGNPVAVHTGATASSGAVTGDADSSGNYPLWYLFDEKPSSFWLSAANQTGVIQYQFTTPKVINGYAFNAAKGINTGQAADNGYVALDYAPSSWVLEASNDGTNYVQLDNRQNHALYDGGRSPVFEFANATAYTYYRWTISSSRRGSGTRIAMSALTMREASPANITVTLNNVSKFNGGAGFKATDVGRLLRVRASDNYYRVVRIAMFISATQVTASLESEPLTAGLTTQEWQAGYFCDTVGWPTCATFFGDRMYVGGVAGAPNVVFGSVVGDYESMEAKTPFNEALDSGALVLPLKARKQSRIRWMESDERGLLIGTGVNEWVISPQADGNLTARSAKARSATERGSAAIAPVKVDRQVLYVQRSRRTVREYAYVYDADGYKSPSMSLFSSHIGVKLFQQLAYAAEPFSIIWMRLGDGTLAGLTYNRDENVVGWHVHNVGGFIETIACLPSRDGLQNALWLVVRRVVNGQVRRYIEQLQRFWDFDSTLADAFFVDCGLRYTGDAATQVLGLRHLEGQAVSGLADGVPFEAVVASGAVTLPNAASNIVVGLPFESFGEIARIDAGSQTGTSQGKIKRIHRLRASFWQSAGGEVAASQGKSVDGVFAFERVPYPEDYSQLAGPVLFDGITDAIPLPRGYDLDGTLAFRQYEPLPFNLVALLPDMETQDAA